ncbi:ATP-binding protein [Nostoc sp. TCL26-01]|uniref:hybrid sensor histidine kinase/response regulator n=1 Tax=Nostoc sp. TCL26-01 TaxID=2576904 RepID=UPI0015BAFDF5|nr:ATP-binding protein [Nostoc sp. TCL26-01]QLE58656.1 hybrid sensor histidine kinase/response regulator [Nostoc sp. TCL26-01]
MDKTTIHILLVEDSPTDAKLLRQVFLRTGEDKWQMSHVELLSEAIDICQASPQLSPIKNDAIATIELQKFDVVLLDLHLPDATGLDTLKAYRAAIPDIPVVVLTGLDDEDLALQALAQGAQDYLVKDQITMQRLVCAIRYAIEREEILHKLRESEERSRQALLKEQELNELKSNFVAMVSHEFRTPMTTIRTGLDLLEQGYETLPKERRAKYFDRIYYAINQMIQLLDEVLFLSKSEAEKLNFNPKLVNLETFCNELVEIFKFGMGNQHNIIFNSVGDITLATMDEDLINCILTNLLSNAVKYSPQQSNIYFDVICQDDIVTFRIQDQGRGIPLKDQPNLFQTFYRATNVGKIQGTGLGLSIVKQCVDIHQGQIDVESQQDVGTTVTVTLPLHSVSK